MWVPMVAGLAFRERLATLPAETTVSLRAEPDNRYNPRAVAVHGPDGKIGYLAPEIARDQYAHVAAAEKEGSPLARRARKRTGAAGRSTGVELLIEL